MIKDQGFCQSLLLTWFFGRGNVFSHESNIDKWSESYRINMLITYC